MLAFAAVAVLAERAPLLAACDVNYSGPTNGAWNTAGNWTPSGVPNGSQNACIPSGKGTITIANGVSAAANTITAASGIQIDSGGSLALGDSTPLSFLNSVTDFSVAAGATCTSAGAGLAVAGQFVLDGTVTITHSGINADGATQLNSGSMTGTGTISGPFKAAGGVVTPGGAGTVGTLHFGSIVTFDGGELDIDLASDSSFDEISHLGNVFILNTTTVQVFLLGNYLPVVSTTWEFIVSEGSGTDIHPGSIVPSAFGRQNVPNGGALILNGSLTTTTTNATTTTVAGSTTTVVTTSTTTTTLATCNNGALDAGEECDQTAFGAVECPGVEDQSCRRCTNGCTVSCSLCSAIVVDSFILPTILVVKPNAATPAKSKLVAAGIFDTGSQAANLGAAADLKVGDLDVGVTLPTPVGSSFVLRSDGFLFKLIPAKTGSSKARFKMKLQRDFTGAVDPNAPVTMEFANPSVDGIGTVRLSGGKYRLRRKPGDLIAPALYLVKVRAKLQGGGKDVLAVQLGFATDGPIPSSAPDVTLAFGPSYTTTIPGGAFALKGGRFVGAAGGVQAILDYRRELLTIRAKQVDLGTFADGAQPVLAGVQLGAVSRANNVRMVRKGKALKY